MNIAFKKICASVSPLNARIISGALVVMIAVAMTLAGSPPANATPPPTSISGFVSTDAGQPLPAHSMINLVDSTGNAWNVTTTVAGAYKATTTGKVAPILINAQDIYGLSLTGSGIANVTPYGDAVLGQTYQALNTSTATQFASPTLKLAPIQLQTELSLFKDVFQQPYAFYKISPTFNPFTTKFTFTGAYKNFLSEITYTGFGTSDQTISSTLGTLDWSATLTADSINQWSNAQWWVRSGPTGPYSGSYGYTTIPTDPSAGVTYAGVNTFYKTTFLPTLKHEGKLLDDFNLAFPKPFYDSTYLDGGKGAFVESEFDANSWRQERFLKVNVGRIISYFPNQPDSSHNLIGVAVDYTISRNGGTYVRPAVENFICGSDGTGCLLYGDQQLGSTCTSICLSSSSFIAGIPTPVVTLRGRLTTPTGTFVGVDLSDSDSSYFTFAPMTVITKTLSIKPVHTLPPITYLQDDWSLRTPITPPFSYTDQFSYFADSDSYSNYVLGYTTEPIDWLSPDPNGSHTLSDFHLGVPTVVKWNPPLTYIPLRVRLDGIACNSTQSIRLNSVQKFIAPTAKTGSIIIPKTVLGSPTTDFKIGVGYEGPYGKRASYEYGVGTCPPL
jgi:hypothetical protein